MPWQSLSASLNTRPRVLAGPILRKVTPTSVTVWLAMRVGASVTLTVQDDRNALLMQGERRSIAIGRHLHIVAVTATLLLPFTNLSEGVVYRYDATFRFDDGSNGNLAFATNNAPLAYAPFTLPSFALPPQDLNLLRLVQGSCRMPHGYGKDMLPFVDQLIAPAASNAFARPHQLLLTGDQIYADDVAAVMLHMLMDATNVLLGWTETMPIPSDFLGGGFTSASQLASFMRHWLLEDEGFPSEDLHSHLISLGEYICMYLFVWSDVLWPKAPATLPAATDVATALVAAMRNRRQDQDLDLPRSRQGFPLATVQSGLDRLASFPQTLPAVRRVLANIPSYMMFDDHEVTDDWNMTGPICKAIYGSDTGLRVMQNALVAYSVCQHWGNSPEEFRDVTPAPPGLALLRLLDTPNPTAANAFQQKAADYDRNSRDIRNLVSVHDIAAQRTRAERGVFHDPYSINYHYTVEGPGHQIIYTDTRTWRSFPGDLTHLLPKNADTDQFRVQIVDSPPAGNRLVLVVLGTTCVTVQPIRTAVRLEHLSNNFKHVPDIYDAWEMPSRPFDRLLTALTSKLPADSAGQRTGAVVLLSGDVHMSFATRLMYRATNRFEDATPQPAQAVVAQLVASSLKKQNEETVGFQREGYFHVPPIPHVPRWVPERLVRQRMTEGYVGWNLPNSQEVVALERLRGSAIAQIALTPASDPTVDVTLEPNVPPELQRRVVLRRAAHYRYRYDYLLPTQQPVTVPVPPPIVPLPAGATPAQRRQAAEAYHTVAQALRTYNNVNPPQVVGLNNFGEIRFEWGAPTARKVNHILRWWDPHSSTLKLTSYAVRLDVNAPNDPQFPDIKAQGEP